MTVREFVEWLAFFELLREDEQKAMHAAAAKAKQR